MELPPLLYHRLVRPKLPTKYYIEDIILQNTDLKNKKVLDFGSGVGTACLMFTPENYLGIDANPDRVNYARRLYPDYAFEVLKGSRLPVSSNSVDYILVIAVLHHISSQDLTVYLQEFRRVLKPDGAILAMEPCFFKSSRINNRLMAFFDKGRHIRTEDEYMSLFTSQCFKTRPLKRFKKLFYNEFFFSAIPVYH